MFSFRNKEETRKGTSLLTAFAVTLSVILIAPFIENSYSVQHEQMMMQNRTHQILQNQTDGMQQPQQQPQQQQHEQMMMQNRTHQILQNQTDGMQQQHEQMMMQNRTHQMS
jgi:hypothetical protein